MDSFWSNIFRRSAPPSTHELLQRVPLFAGLSRSELAAVERVLYERHYAPGEVVFAQGAPGVAMYVVQEGRVEIVFEPGAQRLAVLEPGDFFGEIALLNETHRSATATAQTACTLWSLAQPDLEDLLARNPRLGVKVLHGLAKVAGRRLVRADAQMQHLRTALAEAGVDAPALADAFSETP